MSAATRDLPAGKLPENVMHFARVLRAAGLPLGTGQVLTGIEAVETAGIERRDDLYWALHAAFVTRRDQRDLFDQAFHIFWRNPNLLEEIPGLDLAEFERDEPEPPSAVSRRIADAIRAGVPGERDMPESLYVEEDAAFTWSPDEVLQKKDFEKMTAGEVAEAKKAIARLRLPIMEIPTRRYRAYRRGAVIDMRKTLRGAMRHGGRLIELERKARARRHPPLVVLCDISGSMSQYSRMFLHFMHAITNDRDRVYSFVFGTRLTNITRYLRYRDVDLALEKVADAVEDWSGGTRIGHALRTFNMDWSRRILAQNAVVLIVTDGLDRDAGAGLKREMERLHKSCRRLIWLNPLLRYEGFEPRAQGIQAMWDHVDDFLAVHNLQSLRELGEVLSGEVRPALAA